MLFLKKVLPAGKGVASAAARNKRAPKNIHIPGARENGSPKPV